MRLPRGRRLWLKIHLYLGLTAGALLLMLGLTGSILVFSDEIDRALNPKLATATHFTSATRLSPDEAAAAVERHTGRAPYMLELPAKEGDAYLAFVKAPGQESAEPFSIYLHAQTGEVLASRQWGTFFVSFARRLHTELFMGDAGSWIIAGFGMLGLVSIGTGLYLWWPRGGAWKRALRFHWQPRAAPLNFELHRISGFYLLLALAVITLSGVYLSAPQPFEAAIGAFAELTPHSESAQSTVPPNGGQPLSLATVTGAVERYVPGALVTGFYIPQRANEAFTAYFRDASEPHSDFGRSQAWVDAYSGRILGAQQYPKMSSADRLLAIQILLHNGEIVGPAGRWIVFACGLAMMLLFATGFYLWWVKRR